MDKFMKIALCGPSGSGKTTLTSYITKSTELKFTSQSAQDLLTLEDKENLDSIYGYKGGGGHIEVIKHSQVDPEFGTTFQSLLAMRRERFVLDNDNFIIDRSPVDNLVYYLLQASMNQPDGYTKEMIDRCTRACNKLDVIIFVPYVEGNLVEDNQSRIPSRYYQSLVNSIFKDTINKYLKESIKNYYELPLWDLDWRQKQINQILKFHGVN